jgi:two-component sensor histidine kinase
MMANSSLERDKSSRVALWIERLPLADQSPILRLACTLAIFASAWLLRVVTDPVLPSGFPYVTFFPAVIITSFLFGVRLGFLSGLLCGLVAWYYFIAPLNSFQLDGSRVALGFYVFVVATDLLLVHGMQTANKQLVLEREANRELANAKAVIVMELEQRIEERKQAVGSLRESETKTQLATETAGIGLWQWQISSGNVTWDKTMFDLYGMSPTADGFVEYGAYIACLHPDDAASQDAILQNTVSQCGASNREFRILRCDGGEVRHIRAVEAARAGPDGKTEWVVGTNLDITEEKNRERHVQLLMGEINHRAKNLLAVVLSVANQTSGADHAEFLQKFSARVQSLAAGQDVLVENEWKGVQLDALVRAQLNHFKDLIGPRITIAGDPVQLSPAAVQTIGMAIHELTTNASKYGALSNEEGRIAIAWQKVPGPNPEHLVMNWTESNGPPVVLPEGSGFGSLVTGKIVELSLGGVVTSSFAPAGFSWRLDCPLEHVIERTT